MAYGLKHLLVAGLAVAVATAASAHSYKLGTIEVGHAWTAPVTGSSAIVVLPLLNQGTDADALAGATTPIGVARLEAADDKPVAQIALLPHRPLALRRGHPHIAIDNIAQPLAAGARFPLTLQFAKAGSVTIDVMIEAAPSD